MLHNVTHTSGKNINNQHNVVISLKSGYDIYDDYNLYISFIMRKQYPVCLERTKTKTTTDIVSSQF
jgi:hypothetical protein